MELSLDTSTDIASIALSLRGEVQAEVTWLSEQNHTAELIPNVLHMLQQGKVHVRDVDAVIVAKGPGSFNGLRVGIATAKGFAYALAIPLVGISTLEVEAVPYAATGRPICPVQNAGRGEVTTALYQMTAGHWQRLVPEEITTVQDLCTRTPDGTIFCGRFSPSIAQQVGDMLGEKAVISPGLRRAGYLAELGWRRLKEGDTDDPATLQPTYLRPPSVTKPKTKEVRR